jgi:acetyl esterase/lipase
MNAFASKSLLLAACLALSFLGPALNPAVGLPPPGLPDPSEDAQLRVWHNVSYVPGSNEYRQKMDVVVPRKGGPFPIIVWIHGGAWLQGDKEKAPVEPLLVKGYAAASINYRLSTQAPFPAQIQDCKTAIRFLRAHAKEFNIDPNRIGAWGMSAGGHLVAMLATTNGVKEFEGDGYNNVSSAIQAGSDYCGPADLSHIREEAQGPNWKIDFANPNSPMHLLLAKDISGKRLDWASPLTYVGKGDAPLQIIHGKKDDVVPIAQSDTLFKALQSNHLPSEYTVVAEANHSLASMENVHRTLDFFNRYLKKR